MAGMVNRAVLPRWVVLGPGCLAPDPHARCCTGIGACRSFNRRGLLELCAAVVLARCAGVHGRNIGVLADGGEAGVAITRHPAPTTRRLRAAVGSGHALQSPALSGWIHRLGGGGGTRTRCGSQCDAKAVPWHRASPGTAFTIMDAASAGHS